MSKSVCHVPLTAQGSETIINKMQLKKPCLAFIFFILVNIGQITAQSTEAPEEPETLEAAETPEAAKTEKPFRIGIGLGYSFLGYREETDLPLNRYVDTLSFNFNGNIEKNNFYYSLNFGLLIGETDPLEIESDDDYFTYHQKEAVFLRLYFEHALDYRLWGNSVFPGYLGGALRGDLYYSVMQEASYYNLTMLFSLNIHATQKWIISEGKALFFSASIPFFGYAFRPPYYGLLYMPLDSENRVISFHNYRALFGDLKYHHKISELISFYMGFGFELSHITFPQQRRDASFCINAGITFNF
jgi:hypothetical protein